MVDNLGLSYRNARELNCIIDEHIPGRPQFVCEEIHIGGESYSVFFRDIILCIRALFGDPSFAKRLVFGPERHYEDANHTKQIFSEMHTGKWWWSVQVRLQNFIHNILVLMQLLAIPRAKQPRCNSSAHHYIIGQDAAHPFSVKECLPCLHDNR